MTRNQSLGFRWWILLTLGAVEGLYWAVASNAPGVLRWPLLLGAIVILTSSAWQLVRARRARH